MNGLPETHTLQMSFETLETAQKYSNYCIVSAAAVIFIYYF